MRIINNMIDDMIHDANGDVMLWMSFVVIPTIVLVCVFCFMP